VMGPQTDRQGTPSPNVLNRFAAAYEVTQGTVDLGLARTSFRLAGRGKSGRAVKGLFLSFQVAARKIAGVGRLD